MTTSRPNRSPEENLQRIADMLERLDRKLNPPLWQQGIGFLFSHFMVFATLAGLLFFTWQIWGTISSLLGVVQLIFGKIGSFGGDLGGSVRGVLDGLGGVL